MYKYKYGGFIPVKTVRQPKCFCLFMTKGEYETF